MKSIITMFLFMLILENTNGQVSFIKNITDTTLLTATVIDDIGICSSISTFCVCSNEYTIIKGTNVFVTKLINCEKGYSTSKYNFFEFVYNGNILYCDPNNLYLQNITFKKLSLIDSVQSNKLLKHALVASKTIAKSELESAKIKHQYSKKEGIAVKDFRVYDMSEYTDGTGIFH
jgi:hypothetical protein